MKKTFMVFILMAAGLCVFAQTANLTSGTIRELSGTVELKAAGSSSYVPAKAGDKVGKDTIVSTGFKSYALIDIGSTAITVRPLTRLTLTEISSARGSDRVEGQPGNKTLAGSGGTERVETLNVNLQAGRVRVDVNPPAGTRAAMSVSSPIATASVRGTSFEFDTRNIHVNHGQVAFIGSRGTMTRVGDGATAMVGQDGKAADPVQTKMSSIEPKAPVGTDRSRKSTSKPQATTGIIAINLRYTDIPSGL